MVKDIGVMMGDHKGDASTRQVLRADMAFQLWGLSVFAPINQLSPPPSPSFHVKSIPSTYH